MPNLPLKTFRTVEPANWGFGSTATLASQPFVLGHFTSVAITDAGIDNAAISFNTAALNANRFRPWLARDFDASLTTGSYYPVAVPNAYDRIYIFPMYRLIRSAAVSSFSFGTLSAYAAPYILPMGLAPETRGYTTVNKLNPLLYRFPDDIPPAIAGYIRSANFDIRTHGLWFPLSAYATNAMTSNGFMSVASNTDPRSFGRSPVTGTGMGTAYRLPNDVSISAAVTAGAVTEATAQYQGGTAAAPTTDVLIGMGSEFATMGCQEIVCSLGSLPTGITISDNAGGGVARQVELFLMGMFLG